MCGIAGIIGPHGKNDIMRMSRSIRHRGPDDNGHFYDKEISLAFRRLSIIDLSKKGNQPIYNEDGNLVLLFNGEIYNYLELRDYLKKKGHKFKTDTDSEVIIHLYEEMGPAFLEQLNGMFAIAIWDINKRELFLARDRFGIKPLFFHNKKNIFMFASEFKALLQTKLFPVSINANKLHDYGLFGYQLGDETLIRDIYQIKPGHYMILDAKDNSIKKYTQFFSIMFAPKQKINLSSAKKRLKELLNESVRMRYESADVPVGILLSGGLDSTTMAQICLHQKSKTTDTFSIADDENNPDFTHSKMAAEMLGTRHHEFLVDTEEMLDAVPEMIHATEFINYELCFSHVLGSRVSKKVKTVLCGQGSDEVFGGYYEAKNPQKYKNYMYNRANQLFKKDDAQLMNYKNILDKTYNKTVHGMSVGESNLCFGQASQLHNYQLLIDRTMYFGLEVRVPYLDHNLVGFANRLPFSYKVKGKTDKMILRSLAKDIGVPDVFCKRKKMSGPRACGYFLDDLQSQAKYLLSDDYVRNHKFCKGMPDKARVMCFDIFKEIFVENNGKFSPSRFLPENIY